MGSEMCIRDRYDNEWVTPDFPGAMRAVVESTVGGLCLFLQGASGNQGPIDGFTGDLRVYRKAGARLGAEASRVRLDIDPLNREEQLDHILASGADLGIYSDVPTGESDDTVAVSNVAVQLPSRDVGTLDEAQADFDQRFKTLEQIRNQAATATEVNRAVSAVKRANHSLNFVDSSEAWTHDGHIELNVQSMRIGQTVLVSLPVEPFAELGNDVKKHSHAVNTIFSGFSNGHFKYLPTDMAYEEGGYEVRACVFEPGSADLAVRASLEAIDEVVNQIKQ